MKVTKTTDVWRSTWQDYGTLSYTTITTFTSIQNFKEILRLLLGQFNGVERVIEIPSGSSAHVTPEHAKLLLLRFWDIAMMPDEFYPCGPGKKTLRLDWGWNAKIWTQIQTCDSLVANTWIYTHNPAEMKNLWKVRQGLGYLASVHKIIHVLQGLWKCRHCNRSEQIISHRWLEGSF